VDQGADRQHAHIIQSPPPDQSRRDGAFAFPNTSDFICGVFGSRCDLRFVRDGQTTRSPQLLKRQIECHVNEIAHIHGVEDEQVCSALGLPHLHAVAPDEAKRVSQKEPKRTGRLSPIQNGEQERMIRAD
jgi:hypothetical protein